MRSILTLTLLTTIKISLSGKEYDDLKLSAESNDFQFDESQDRSHQGINRNSFARTTVSDAR